MSKQQKKNKLFLCFSECNVQFQPYLKVQTCEKNMKKMVSMSVFKIKQMCQLPP